MKLTVRQAQEYLANHGVKWTQEWIRRKIGDGSIVSELQYNSRLIKTSELDRMIKLKREREERQTAR